MRVSEDDYVTLRNRTTARRSVTSQPVQRKPSKYRNKIVEVNGEHFDSRGEARRCFYLREMQRLGKISDLQRQVEMPIVINDMEICFYRADFVYMEDGIRVVEDYKGAKTDMFILKKNLLRALYGIEIKEVTHS